MNPFRQRVEDLADRARELHIKEHSISLESVDLVGALEKYNASGYLMLGCEDLAKRIGLTKNQFWKRAQVARLLRYFPAFRDLVTSGSTTVSNLALVAPHVSQATAARFLAELPGKSQHQVSLLLSGQRAQETSALDRALAVANLRGRRLTKSELIAEALNMWLNEWESAPSLKKEPN